MLIVTYLVASMLDNAGIVRQVWTEGASFREDDQRRGWPLSRDPNKGGGEPEPGLSPEEQS